MKTFRIRFTAMILFVTLTSFLLVPPASSPGGSITITGKLEYVDELGGLSPMRRVKVYLMDNDVWEGFPQDEEVAWQYTDDIGNFEFIVDNDDGLGQDGRDPYIIVESSNPAAVAMSSSSVIYTMQLPQVGKDVTDGFFHDYGAVHPDLNNEAWQAIDAVLSVRDWIFDQVAWERPMVTIYWPSGGWPRSYGDTIHLPDKSLWPWDHVRVHREYGLSVLYTLYGNTFPTGYPGPAPPQRVFFESGPTFALVEGWASFIQCAVDNNPDNLVDWYGGHGGNIETNDWFNCLDVGDMDGEMIEGSVASILWDVFDPANDDPLSLGFDEIFHIIRNYKPTHFSSFWNWWVLLYPAYQGDLSTICWAYGINRDFYPPTGSIVINGGAVYTTSTSVTLTVSASDYGSGVAYMRFSNFPAWFWGIEFPQLIWSFWYPYDTSASWTLSPGDGLKTVYAQFMDKTGLITSPSSLAMDTIILDTSALTASIVINGGDLYTKSRSVTLTLAYSDVASGVDVVRYRNDGEGWTDWEPPSATRAWTLRDLDGTRTVYYQVRDEAGLVSAEYSDTIVLDRVPPTASILINTGDTYTSSTSVTLSLAYSDATSGVDVVRYRNDLEGWKPWEAPSNVKLWTLRAVDGTRTVYYQVRDNAGWTSTVVHDTIILDSTPPATTYSHGNPSSVVYLSASDGLSGVAATYYRIDSGSWKLYGGSFILSAPPPHTHIIDYYSVDNAGNQENPKTLKVHYLSITAYPPEVWTALGGWTPAGGWSLYRGWYTEGTTAVAPWPPHYRKVPGWNPWKPGVWNTTYTFSTWKLDGVVVSGKQPSVLMDGPHHFMAAYFGMRMIYVPPISSTDDKYLMPVKLRITTGDTQYVNAYLKLTGPDLDKTYSFFTLTLPGGLDIYVGPFDVPIPKKAPKGIYTFALYAVDETSGLLSVSYFQVGYY